MPRPHSRGVRILGGTITPFENALEGFVEGYYHLHPNDAGYRAMADAVDLRALSRERR